MPDTDARPHVNARAHIDGLGIPGPDEDARAYADEHAECFEHCDADHDAVWNALANAYADGHAAAHEHRDDTG